MTGKRSTGGSYVADAFKVFQEGDVVSMYMPDNPIFDRWTPSPPPPADLVERAVSLWGYAALVIMRDGTFRLTFDTEDAFHNEAGDIVSPEFAAAVIKEFEHALIRSEQDTASPRPDD
jgi:hypothetical protein